MVRQRLDQSPPTPHSYPTSGQSHWGGLITSCRARWSSSLGRVVVAYVQGSPKGGDALCVRRVISTRLRPVPPSTLEAGLYRGLYTNSTMHRLYGPPFPHCGGGQA